MKLLIQNGRVVHPVTNAVLLQDLLIEDGKISLLERKLPPEADQIIDASGMVVCPGLVDMHVHLRDPGLTYKEDILTGCAAAARGGVTSMACMAVMTEISFSTERPPKTTPILVFPFLFISDVFRSASRRPYLIVYICCLVLYVIPLTSLLTERVGEVVLVEDYVALRKRAQQEGRRFGK